MESLYSDGIRTRLFTSSLTALEVNLLGMRYVDYGDFPLYSRREDGIYESAKVSAMLKRHPELKSLYIDIDGDCHPDVDFEREHALENIGSGILALSHLTSLTLDGGLRLTDKAWSIWSEFPWNQLESLSLGGHALINDFSRGLLSRPLPSIKTIRLSAIRAKRPPELPDFVLGSGVSHLCLTHWPGGEATRYLRHSPTNARNIESLQVYGRHHPEPFTVSDMQELAACPNLKTLGLEFPYQLPIDGASYQWSKTLASLQSVKHIYLNLYTGPKTPEDHGQHEKDVIDLFRLLYDCKTGRELDSVDVFSEDSHLSLRAYGDGRIMMDARHADQPRQLRLCSEDNHVTAMTQVPAHSQLASDLMQSRFPWGYERDSFYVRFPEWNSRVPRERSLSPDGP
jgi:hypothetical protein